MKLPIFSSILTACLATLTLSLPLATKRDEIKVTIDPFPYPESNETIPKYTAKYASWRANLVSQNVSIITASEYTPNWGIDFIFEWISSAFGNLPGFNNSFDIPDFNNSQIRWLVEAENRTEDDPVILFSHGGGFSLPLTSNQVDKWANLYNLIGNDRLSIVILDYTISLIAPFPQPVIEIIKAYNYLTESSKNIWLAGDSAGGTLSLELIRQFYESYDGVPEVTSSLPNGLIALSPWVNLYPSYTGTYLTYNGIDKESYTILDQFGKQYESDLDILNSKPLNTYYKDFGWSKYLPPSQNIFVSYGEKEVLKGDILSWIQLATLNGSGATIYEDINGTHDGLFSSNSGYLVLVEFLQKKL